MSDVLVIDSSDSAVTIVTLNRPQKRNALNLELIENITSAFNAATHDLSRRVVLVKAEGPVFCAGLDLNEASNPATADASAHALCKMYQTICSSPLITLAAAQGAAMGGGAGLLGACDFAVVSDDFRLAYPEVHRGLVAAIVTTLLRRQLCDRAARELVLLGQSIDAATALELGLVNQVVPTARLIQAAMSLAIESCKGAPGAIARSKTLLDALSARPISLELNRSMEYHLHARNSAEAREGLAAFLEKRAPRWGSRPAADDIKRKESDE
jgi:methylglutaconyl-CoA hydratase